MFQNFVQNKGITLENLKMKPSLKRSEANPLLVMKEKSAGLQDPLLISKVAGINECEWSKFGSVEQ